MSEVEAYARDLESGRIGIDFIRRRIRVFRLEIVRAREQGASPEKIDALLHCVADLQSLVKRSTGAKNPARRSR